MYRFAQRPIGGLRDALRCCDGTALALEGVPAENARRVESVDVAAVRQDAPMDFSARTGMATRSYAIQRGAATGPYLPGAANRDDITQDHGN
jgi:hypothetical protein